MLIKDRIRPNAFNQFALTDEDDIYALLMYNTDTPAFEVRASTVLPPNAQVVVLGHQPGTVATLGLSTSDGAATQIASINFWHMTGVGGLGTTGPSLPIILKKYPSLYTAGGANSLNLVNFAVLSDYYNVAQLKWGLSATTGGSGVKVISSLLNPISYTKTGDTNYTTVFEVDLGASYAIRRVGMLGVAKCSGGATGSVKIDHSTDAAAWTEGTAATTASATFVQVHPTIFENITARHIRIQIKTSAGAQTVALDLHWLPCWVAR